MSLTERIYQAKANKNAQSAGFENEQSQKDSIINKLIVHFQNEAVRFAGSENQAVAESVREYMKVLRTMTLSELQARL